MAPKAKKIRKPLVESYFIDDQMERFSRPSQIEFEERERPKFSEAKFKGRFLFVGDTDWGNLDPIQTITSVEPMSQEDLAKEIIHSCGLFRATMMPFAIPFPNLCYEVSKKCKLDKRVLLDIEGNVIMDFFPSGIEAAFGWKRYGDDYSIRYSEEFHDTYEDYIRNWLQPNF